MTEDQWQSCVSSLPMLKYLRPKASVRKMRLFAAACCRRIWPLLTEPLGRRAVELAELLAEGLVIKEDDEDFMNFRSWVNYKSFDAIDGFREERENNIAAFSLEATYNALYDERATLEGAASRAGTPDLIVMQIPGVGQLSARGGPHALEPDLLQVPLCAAWAVAHWHRKSDSDTASEEDFDAELKEQVKLVRDIFGNPFRPARINRIRLNSSVVWLAQTIYNDKSFERMPEVAAELAEIGCINNKIVQHCREATGHVRGCWALDLILGRE